MTRRDKTDLWLLGAGLLTVRIAYALVTPFVFEGDAHHYYQYMMVPFHSNLLQPSGYPFFFSWVIPLGDFLRTGRVQLLRVAQNLFPIFVYLLFFRATRPLVGRRFAFWTTLLIGTNFFALAEASFGMPDFLVDIWVLLLISVLLLAGQAEGRKKTALYLFAGPLFAYGYLIKYNFVAFAPLLGLLLLDRSLSLGARLRRFAGGAALGFAVIALYIVGFHQPTTGTYHLNLEHGWVYGLKLVRAGIVPSPEFGPATQRFLVLAHELPLQKECCSGNWLRIDTIPDEVRAPYRRKYAGLLAGQDPRPAFEAAGRPSASYGDFQRLYYYLGLEEAELVMASAFREALRARPKAYWAHSWNVGLELAWHKSAGYTPRVPVVEPSSPWFPVLYSKKTPCHVLSAEDPRRVPGTDLVPIERLQCPGMTLWGAKYFRVNGMRWLSLLAWPHLLIPDPLFWGVLALGAAMLLGKARAGQAWDRMEALLALLLVSLAIYLAGSALLYLVREKEVLACQSAFFLSLALSSRGLWEALALAQPKRREAAAN